MEEELFEALEGLLTTGAVFDPETDPEITAAIRKAAKVMDKAREQRRKPS